MNRLVLIDGHAIIHRAYHAYPQTLKTRNGELMNAVYGFTSILLSVLKELKPEYVACAFDLPVPTFRHKKYKKYKAHRPKIDKELKQQIPKAKGVVKTLNIPIFEKEGYEADDVIGSLAFQAKLPNIKNEKQNIKNTYKISKNKKRKRIKEYKSPRKFLETIIVTGDKDALQLIDNNIKVFMPGRGQRPAKMFNRKRFLKKYGFEPRQLIDYKALCGDPSDNIPGVKGVGPKTTTKLIIKFGGIKQIYENIGKIESKVVDKLTNQKDQAFLSLELAEIVTNVPIKLDLKKCRLLDYDKEKIIRLFEELEFRSLIGRLPGIEKGAKTPKLQTSKTLKNKDGERQMGLF